VKREHVATRHAPLPIGPYSQAVQSGSELYCSGQIPLDPETGEIVSGDAAVQAERVIENLGAILCAAGYHYEDVVKTTVFLVDMNDFPAVNTVYEKYFGASKPARSTVAVAALPRGARVEIDCIARD
jgi:2-iminobutanoate/2-iminopropanoate deaminase